MKSASHSKGLQTSRTLALAEFQYANDNGNNYPDVSTANSSGAATATAVAYCLLAGGYISDPSIFVISGGNETAYTGSVTGPSITTGNISWDFAGNTNSQGVNPNAPDTLPIVWSSVGTTALPSSALQASGAISVTLSTSNPFGTAGMAVCYKSNSASFLTATGSSSKVSITTAAYPSWTATNLPGGG